MEFKILATFLEKLEKTSSRNEITRILADLFKSLDVNEIDKVCYLLSGRLVPAYEGIEFNLAEKMMMKILAKAYNQDISEVVSLYKMKGDLGDVASVLAKKEVRGRGLNIVEVYSRLLEVAKEAGEGSQDRKVNKMSDLFSEVDPLSARYLARIPTGNLRLGFSDITMLDALSVMEIGDKTARPKIEAAYNIVADIGKIAQLVKKGDIDKLSFIKAKPGIPIRPSLAERLSSPEEIIEKAGPKVAIEPKLDGFRTQIHVWKENAEKKVALFSRNLENTTFMFPDIAESAKRIPVESAILDSESIAYNRKSGKFLAFQETVQRKRKHGIEEMLEKLPLYAFVFDILYLNGESLVGLPFYQRREILVKTLGKFQGRIKLAKQMLTDNPRVIEREVKKNIQEGLEGIVAKRLDVPYQAGARGFHWIKFKATTAALEKLRKGERGVLADTIDCVVMGAYKGRGKRATFGVGGFLLGVRGKDDKFYTITRLGSGLSDEEFREAYRRVQKLQVGKKPKEYVVLKDTEPDIWLKPSLVVEILADEISLSPRHTAGKKGERGYSLRFPRLVRFRDDKDPEDATSVDEVVRLYKLSRH